MKQQLTRAIFMQIAINVDEMPNAKTILYMNLDTQK